MPFLASTLDNADLLYALMIALGFYLHHVELADQGFTIVQSRDMTVT